MVPFKTLEIATPLGKGLTLVDGVGADEVADGVLEVALPVVVARMDIDFMPLVATSR